jgi:hypothetical protein
MRSCIKVFVEWDDTATFEETGDYIDYIIDALTKEENSHPVVRFVEAVEAEYDDY